MLGRLYDSRSGLCGRDILRLDTPAFSIFPLVPAIYYS
jgi:hypothetical protein